MAKKKSTSTSFTPGIKGVLDVAKHGMGYVTVPGMTMDIVVRKENLKDAMHGDTVEVHIFKLGRTTKRPEGVIARVIKRNQQEIIGTIDKKMNFAFVVPDNKSFFRDVFINEPNAKKLNDGDRVIVRITDWNSRMKNPEGIVIDVLNNERSNDIAMKQILLEQGFRLEFPDEVTEELKGIKTYIDPEEVKRRRDFRNIFTITIDPHDAKDFDDAISFRELENGLLEIGVHIADVTHYVKPGTALDKEAFERATSVYLPDRVLPMLPEKISNELCSLRPLEDKCTFSVVYEMDRKGRISNEWIGRTLIHSNHRFTYEEVQEIIEGGDDPHQKEILAIHQISQSLRAARMKHGAINFASEEIRFRLDEEHKPVEVIVKESKACHQLIEELMLLANKSVAIFVDKQGKIPFPYRIHDTPDLEKLRPYADFAKALGYPINLKTPETIAHSFNAMVKDSASHPDHKILQTLGIRTMAKAIYSINNIGHYGLAFKHYCHFTSPIRRYPDVLVHRVLMECLEKQVQPNKQMEELCKHCSEKERKAMDAEREGNKYKQVEFLQQYLGEEFEAVISGIAAFGVWAQTIEHRCEGFISMQQFLLLGDYKYVEEEYALIAKNGKRKFRIGQPIRVKIVAANLVKRQVDLDLVV